MKKRFLSLLLASVMTLSLLPTGAFAAQAGSVEGPVELGSIADYQNVLDATYDENGLRVARVGYNMNGRLNGERYGIINQDGNWVAQPIYDEIVCYAWDMRLRAYESSGAMNRATVTPVVFIGGYTQAKRDGKMGLLGQNGEEVIPCRYDYVQTPSEGMAAVYQTIDKDAFYLGYWSLEENREVVAPNKYVTYKAYIGSPIGDPDVASSARQKPAGDYNQIHDFMDGYALVTLPELTGINVTRRGVTYPGKISTIIDKTGKEVLPKPYPIVFDNDDYSTYPQKGCYLTFIEKIDLSNYLWTRYSGNPKAKGDKPLDVSYTYASGLVSPAGVQIPPTYTTGVIASAGEGQFFINPATFGIYPEANLVITKVDAWPGIFGGGADTAIDLKGKTKVPPMQDLTNDAFWYDAEYQLLATPNGVYKATGEKLLSHNGGVGGFYVENGCAIIDSVGDYIHTDAKNGCYAITKYAVDYKGNVLNLTKRMNWPVQVVPDDTKVQKSSNLSLNGYLWVQSNERKWGLLDMTGKEILPFVYDAVNFDAWTDKDLCYAVVTQNGKQGIIGPKGELLTPIEYTKFAALRTKTYIEAWKDGKVGLVDPKTGKVTLPVKYDKVGLFDANYQWNPDYFATGSCAAKIGKDIVFVDRAGNEVYTRKHSETNSELNLTIEAQAGLYTVNEGLIDSRGRLIVPKTKLRDASIDFATSEVIYKEGGRVYRQSANGLGNNYTFKPFAPQTATAAPSATKLMVNGSPVAVDAYSIAGNNYLKLRDLATMVNGGPKSFEVSWDDGKKAINLVSGKPYTPVGGEMVKGDGQSKAAQRNSAKIYLDGGEVSMTAYTIGSSNYFKLRDVMQIFDIGVGYDNASKTATVNTAEGYALIGDAARYQQADEKAYTEAGGKLDADGTVKQTQIYKEPRIRCLTTPKKVEYYVGDGFDSTGFKGLYEDIYGNSDDITAQFTFDIDGSPITNGYVFQKVGKLIVSANYKGKSINKFPVTVFEKTTEKDLPLVDGGSYYIKLMGKYLTISNNRWMVLGSEKPEKPFSVKYLGVDTETGHHLYQVIYNNSTIHLGEWSKGSQLLSGRVLDIPHKWRIAKYSDFWTMRDGIDQSMAVCSSAASSKDGTKVIIWPQKGKAPEHAKLQFVPAG